MPRAPWRYILHADLDAFYASVEQLDNPAYRGSPLVGGGSVSGRGVVAAASYEARKYGIHSAMPMRTAVRLCPEVVQVLPRFSRYREVSGQVMGIFHRLTPLVEPLSLDEAYLDISRQVPSDMLEEVARGLKAAVKEETGLVITVGGGTSKTISKIASQLAKPDGLMLIMPGGERSFLDPLDVDLLWGVGPKTAEILKHHRIGTIGELAGSDLVWLSRTFGKRGPELKERALGREQDRVEPFRETKSVSSEVTLPKDVGDRTALEKKMEELAQEVAVRLRKEELRGKTIWVKLRLADFTTFTRQQTFNSATDDAETIFRVARDLMRRELRPGLEFRLLGVGVTNFQESSQLTMFPTE